MVGIYRGMPRIVAVVAICLSACSQDPQFVDKGIALGTNSDDLTRESCEIPNADLKLECLSPREQMAIEPGEVAAFVGEKKEFKAFIVFPNGEKKDVSKDVVWSAFPREDVRVNGEGEATFLAVGDLKIEASLGRLTGASRALVSVPEPPKDPYVSVTIDRVDDLLIVPVGTIAIVEWRSDGVASCKLIVDGREIDRRPSGSISEKIGASGDIVVSCKTELGDEIQDSVKVEVTRPAVTLTANGSTTGTIIAAGKPIELNWWSSNAESCSVTGDGVTLESGVSGSKVITIKKGQTIQAHCLDSAGNSATSALEIGLNYESRFVFSAGHRDKIEGSVASRPVSIVFALDVTGSMSSQIETVKSNIVNFVSELTKRDFNPMLGVIPFRDKVPVAGNLGDVAEGRLDLTYDANVVKNFVSTLKAWNGGDANEASLAAIQESIKLLRDGDSRPDAVKIVMLVTDQPGHNGHVTTDCDLTPTINTFAGLTESEQQSFKLFYSSSVIGTTCNGFVSGQSQMAELLSKVLLAEPTVEKRGGLIPWPFAATNLMNDMVTMLEKVTPAIELACMDQNVKISLNGSPFSTWTPPDPSLVFAQLEANSALTLNKVLTEDEYNSFVAGGGRMDISRCCVSRAAALAGDFGSCLKTVTVSDVPFTLEE